jgi:hypothetical protein
MRKISLNCRIIAVKCTRTMQSILVAIALSLTHSPAYSKCKTDNIKIQIYNEYGNEISLTQAKEMRWASNYFTYINDVSLVFKKTIEKQSVCPKSGVQIDIYFVYRPFSVDHEVEKFSAIRDRYKNMVRMTFDSPLITIATSNSDIYNNIVIFRFDDRVIIHDEINKIDGKKDNLKLISISNRDVSEAILEYTKIDTPSKLYHYNNKYPSDLRWLLKRSGPASGVSMGVNYDIKISDLIQSGAARYTNKTKCLLDYHYFSKKC